MHPGNQNFFRHARTSSWPLACTFPFEKSAHDHTQEWVKNARRRAGPNRRWFQWDFAATGQTRGIYFSFLPRILFLRLNLRIDEQAGCQVRSVPWGAQIHPQKIPWETNLADCLVDPLIKERFQPKEEGFYLPALSRQGPQGSIQSQSFPLDAKTIEQLNDLGYLR